MLDNKDAEGSATENISDRNTNTEQSDLDSDSSGSIIEYFN